MGLKALSIQLLQRNSNGNPKETSGFLTGKPGADFEETGKHDLPPVFATADNHPCRGELSFKACLQDDVLMTSGVTDDLAGEIVKLTTDDLPLQRRLLKLHCGIYSGPWWSRLVDRWQERTAIMVHDGGLFNGDAEHQAAVCLRAEAFLDELRGVL